MTSLQRALSRAVRSSLAQRGMTQKQLAIRCDLSEKHVSRVLNGSDEGSFEVWQHFAQALGLRWQVDLGPVCREQGLGAVPHIGRYVATSPLAELVWVCADDCPHPSHSRSCPCCGCWNDQPSLCAECWANQRDGESCEHDGPRATP